MTFLSFFLSSAGSFHISPFSRFFPTLFLDFPVFLWQGGDFLFSLSFFPSFFGGF